MSSALAMVLMAAVPGSGPESVSAETEQRLDLRGAWEIIWIQGDRSQDGTFFLRTGRGQVTGGTLTALIPGYGPNGNGTQIVNWSHKEIFDDGGGKLRLSDRRGGSICGIYRYCGDARLLICWPHWPLPGQRGPASFDVSENRQLFILQRRKAGK